MSESFIKIQSDKVIELANNAIQHTKTELEKAEREYKEEKERLKGTSFFRHMYPNYLVIILESKLLTAERLIELAKASCDGYVFISASDLRTIIIKSNDEK